jgi:hypothetical protein
MGLKSGEVVGCRLNQSLFIACCDLKTPFWQFVIWGHFFYKFPKVIFESFIPGFCLFNLVYLLHFGYIPRILFSGNR